MAWDEMVIMAWNENVFGVQGCLELNWAFDCGLGMAALPYLRIIG